MNSEWCCDIIEINLDYHIGKLSAGIEPDGIYRKKEYLWNDMVVYHNSETDMYLYNSGNNHTWVVSI